MEIYIVMNCYSDYFGSDHEYCGAFTTREKAEKWIRENEGLNDEMEIIKDTLE